MERLTRKIHSLQKEIRKIRLYTQPNTQAAQIQYVNSIIMGLAQYLQPSIHHIKSSLTTKSKDVYFTLDGNRRVEWLEQPFEVQPDKSTKQMIASSILKTRLANGPAKATDVLEELKNEGIGERTIHQVKKQLEIRSVKRDAAWYWLLPESEMSSGR